MIVFLWVYSATVTVAYGCLWFTNRMTLRALKTANETNRTLLRERGRQ